MAKIIKFGTCNGRKDNIQEDWGTTCDWDKVRWAIMKQHLSSLGLSAWGGQEWTVNMCNDLMEAFPNWTYAGGVKFGNSPIVWDTAQFFAEEETLLERRYPSGKVERYANLIRLQHTVLPWGAWFGSMHLAVESPDEPNSPSLRAAQMRAIIADFKGWIADHPHPEDGKPNLIVAGDLNDDAGDGGGVRKIAWETAEWKSLVRRLGRDKIQGDSYRSANHWHKTSSLPRDGKQIDEIFTSGVDLSLAALKRTCTDIYRHHATDHNTYVASVILPEVVLP